MGIHLSMYENGKEAPHNLWDFTRHTGDREAFDLLFKQGYETTGEGEDQMYRPKDVEAYRASLHSNISDNPHRWDQMCDLFARQPNLHLYASR